LQVADERPNKAEPLENPGGLLVEEAARISLYFCLALRNLSRHLLVVNHSGGATRLGGMQQISVAACPLTIRR